MSAAAPGRFRAGLVQLRSGRSIAPNLEIAETLIAEAAKAGASYIQTPENTALMELEPELALAQAAPEADSVPLARLRELAASLNIWLHVGSLAVKLAPDRLANRSFLIAPDGSIVARYDKIHMFDVDLPDGDVYRESATYQPGSRAVLADLPWGRLGLSICYDLRFAALYRALAEAGATLLTVPAAFTRQTGEAHWKVLLRARAIETGCFVMAAAQGGVHENGRATYGHSMIVSPWGEVLAEAGEDPQFILADIDPAQCQEVRGRLPALSHGRAFEIEMPAPADSKVTAAV
ncbi:carbon-nitrogen hydrolase family protein [Methyloligella sp. 2.7D]|uniref:carbon-nitrogen hydrolase family protein n=1 Tax=unclassified Methyloligella TaxID=2625955 RepID=UPI00157D4EF9|nr:carbon-nitrogen hydrolase family protein [Methyloligella sp. GL2]QKP76600.1 carbon-nitrogen hydrolase family protein [Methyloligella sp. GL2]